MVLLASHVSHPVDCKCNDCERAEVLWQFSPPRKKRGLDFSPIMARRANMLWQFSPRQNEEEETCEGRMLRHSDSPPPPLPPPSSFNGSEDSGSESDDSQETQRLKDRELQEADEDRELQEFLRQEAFERDRLILEEARDAFMRHRTMCIGLLHWGIDWLAGACDDEWCLRERLHSQERSRILNVYSGASEIYLGGTQFPLRRFVGDKEVLQLGLHVDLDPERPMMRGHRQDGWGNMVIIAFRWGKAGPLCEEDAIKWCKYDMDPDNSAGESGNPKVKNKAIDARGLSGKPGIVNMIYVCYNLNKRVKK